MSSNDLDMQTDLGKLIADFKTYSVKTDKELLNVKSSINKLGEIINVNYQMITDFNRKFDILFNGGTKNPVTEVVDASTQKQTKSTKNDNVLEIFQEKFIEKQSAWDSILESETFRDTLFEEHKSEWDGKEEAEKLKIQCNLLYKSLTTAQKTKVKKLIKSFQTEDVPQEVTKDDVESSIFVKEEKAPKKKPAAKKAKKPEAKAEDPEKEEEEPKKEEPEEKKTKKAAPKKKSVGGKKKKADVEEKKADVEEKTDEVEEKKDEVEEKKPKKAPRKAKAKAKASPKNVSAEVHEESDLEE